MPGVLQRIDDVSGESDRDRPAEGDPDRDPRFDRGSRAVAAFEIADLALSEPDHLPEGPLGEAPAFPCRAGVSAEIRRDRPSLAKTGDHGGWPPDASHIDAIVADEGLRALSPESTVSSRPFVHAVSR
jgi:hypothetical protein